MSLGRKLFREALNKQQREMIGQQNIQHEDSLSPLLDSEQGSVSDAEETDILPSSISQGSWREQVVLWLDSSYYSHLWECVDAAINLLLVSIYIAMTVFSIGPRDQRMPPPPPMYLQNIDGIVAIILLLQFIPKVYFSLDPTSKMVSQFSILTYLTCLPVIWVTYFAQIPETFLEGGNMVFFYPFRFWRLHYALCLVFGPGKSALFRMSLIKQKAVVLGLNIFSTLVTVTAWVHAILYMIQKYYDLSFFDVFYTIVVSSTSGLNTEIVPDNIFSRLVTIYVMVIGAIFIPSNLSELLGLINSTSKFTAPFKSSGKGQHVILVGNLEISALRGFLREFFSEDHGAASSNAKVVMINPIEPSERLVQLISDPVYLDRVKYIKASALSFHALKKAEAASCSAVFVLTSAISDLSEVEEDANTVMRTLILLPRNKIHLQGLADRVLCLDEFKMGVIAQNCIAPGLSTMIYLLTTSISPKAFNFLKMDASSDVMAYLNGALNEIYEIILPKKYVGLSYAELSLRIYASHKALLVGLGIPAIDGSLNIELNSLEHIISGDEHAFLITTDQSVASKVQLGLQDIQWPTWDAPDDLVRRIDKNSKTATSQIPDENEDLKSRTSSESRSTSASSRARRKAEELIYLSNRKKQLMSKGEVEEDAPDMRGGNSLELTGESSSSFKEFQNFGSPIEMHIKTELQLTDSSSPDILNEEATTPTTKLKNPPLPTEHQKPPLIPPLHSFSSFGSVDDAETSLFLISGHLLFCCLGPKFPIAVYFVAPFRKKCPEIPIVFLCEGSPDPEEWKHLETYGNIYHVFGTSLRRKDLAKVNIKLAQKCIILTDSHQQVVHDRIADSSVLLSLLNIQALTEIPPFTMVEFIHKENMKFIGKDTAAHFYAMPSEVNEIGDHIVYGAFMAGRVFSQSMFHSILAQSYYTPNLIHFLKAILFNGGSQHQIPKNLNSSKSLFSDVKQKMGMLFQIEIPEKFIGIKCSDLFVYLLSKYSCTLLALYRLGQSGSKYIIIHPVDYMLQEEDSILILGPEPPNFDQN